MASVINRPRFVGSGKRTSARTPTEKRVQYDAGSGAKYRVIAHCRARRWARLPKLCRSEDRIVADQLHLVGTRRTTTERLEHPLLCFLCTSTQEPSVYSHRYVNSRRLDSVSVSIWHFHTLSASLHSTLTRPLANSVHAACADVHTVCVCLCTQPRMRRSASSRTSADYTEYSVDRSIPV